MGDNRLGILLRGRLGVNLIRSGGGGLYYYGMRYGMKRMSRSEADQSERKSEKTSLRERQFRSVDQC